MFAAGQRGSRRTAIHPCLSPTQAFPGPSSAGPALPSRLWTTSRISTDPENQSGWVMRASEVEVKLVEVSEAVGEVGP